MKLSELRPCDSCGGKVVPQFFIIDVKQAFFSPKAWNTTAGLITMFGGLGNPGALKVAETMSSDAEVVKMLPTETQLFLCQQCYLMPKEDLAILVEKRNRRKDEEEKKHAVPMGRSGDARGEGSEAGTGEEQQSQGPADSAAKTG